MSVPHSASSMGEEPPMYLQRPSSARSQDVSHILAKTFRQLFTRDTVPPDTVQYLHTSRGGDNEYHETYVEALKKIQEERDRRMSEAAMLERHIMQAEARAMSADERALNRITESMQGFPDLGLPPVKSHFRSCIDTALLRKHNLITPDDLAVDEPPIVPPPSAPRVPTFARETCSSAQRRDRNGEWESPLPSIRGSIASGHLTSDGESEDSVDFFNLPKVDESNQLPRNDLWKEQMSTEEREMNRFDLANLQAKVDFLKNPRHIPPSASGGGRALVRPWKKRPKEIGIKPAPEKETTKEPSLVFVASPSVVTFKEYSVGQVYEMTLELKNVTTVLRPVRVIPPKTQYFSVGLGQFPGEQGLVAPGMSCYYTVRFVPDSLGDFDDVLTVQTQSSTPLAVQIQGRRPPPCLTLPSTIDVGQCLVGGMKVAQFQVRNDGGRGRFCLVAKSSWPTSNFKSVTSLGMVSIPPFQVQPQAFELKQGASMLVEVLFSPPAVQAYEQHMAMVCDNCHVQYFTVVGEGQTAGVELTSIEGGLSDPGPGELCDLTAQQLIKFENLNPYTYVQKLLSVKNTTNVDLPFDWLVVKPYIKVRDPESSEDPSIPRERVQDVDSVFSIHPEKGIAPASGTAEFVLTFAPPEVSSFNSVLHLVLRNIPKPLPAVQEKEGSDGVAEIVLPPSEPKVEDLTALEIEVKGVCEPLSVILQPYAVHIPGQTLVQTSVKRQFRMINNSISAVVFQWDKHSGSYILEVEPSVGELGAQCEFDFELSVSGSEVCKVDHTLCCHIQHMEEPLMLNVQAEIKGPDVILEQSDVDFGLVRLGETATTMLTVRNVCHVPAKWLLAESATHRDPDVGEDASEFRFFPEAGELRPLETRDVCVTFCPKTSKSLRTVFELRVDDGGHSAIAVRSEVQRPEVCFLSCDLCLAKAYIDVAVCHQVELLNQTLLPTTFEWGEVEGDQSSDCTVEVEPRTGIVEPREHLQVALYFTPQRTGAFSGLVIPCVIGGMARPIFLSLSAEVKGLSVTYMTPPDGQTTDSGYDEDEELLLDFGQDVRLGDNPTKKLIIKNNSAIPAPFTITVGHFLAKPPTPPEKKPDYIMPNKGSQRRGMLGKTANLADPLSKPPAKVQAELSKAMLSAGKGASFTVAPSSGTLPPFADQVIEVSSFSDMWGQYTDQLTCRVEKLEEVQVPIQLGVTGSSLHFQMVAAAAGQLPILRFGTHVAGIGPITRQMRINNPCPCDVRIDWQEFNKKEGDRQVIDFLVAYGQAFPLRDSHGNELVPSGKVPDKPVRHPTSFIMDSPDSTPATSHEGTGFMAHDSPRETEEPPASLASQRPKVMSVTLREHGGHISSAPFSIRPSQLVIPARGSGCINVSFTPVADAELTSEKEHLGFALGYLSLPDKVSCVKNKVSRQQGYGVTPLRLEMTAQVKPALLTIECKEDEGMRYHAAVSDLMRDGQLVPECLKLCSTTLTNHTQTALAFRLLSTEPFYIMHLDPVSRQPIAQLLHTDRYTLRPRQNAMVQVAFRVSMDLLEYLDLLSTPDGDRPHQPPEGVELEEEDGERKLHFRHNLVVEFSNNSVQRLGLHASLVVPSLVLSKESLDFGTCLVGQRREMQILLSNPTGSITHWTCVKERRSESCDASTFEILPSSGSLDAYITHISNSKVLIQIYFTAKHNEAYDAVYIFHGMLGEEPRKLFLRGQGSYDGKHEAIVNV